MLRLVRKSSNILPVLHRTYTNSSPSVTYDDRETHRVLITGGLGQLGIGLARKYGDLYGRKNVFLSDIKRPSDVNQEHFQYRYLNVTNENELHELVARHDIDTLIHFSALLSVIGETNVPLAMEVNIRGMENALKVSQQHHLRVFVPSTIGAFGIESPLENVPDLCIQRPKTIYGVSKVYGELLGEYLAEKHNLDFRCLRFPGVISPDTKPGGGTTDYAVKIFHDALSEKKHHLCPLAHNTTLPMMYIDDCLRSVIEIMSVPPEQLKQRVFNVNAMSFSPQQIYSAIKKRIPEFTIDYRINKLKQSIADTWPKLFDDINARTQWNWKHNYSMDELIETMLTEIGKK
ncbi:hypothetical protein SNEBB_005457 [Seison nebaliae]|nr:hypothetical protein SNEBB_005457 [Seison nebaliae]